MSKKKTFGVGAVDPKQILQEEKLKLHKPSTEKELVERNFREMKTSIKNWYGKKTKFVTIFGAAGLEDIPQTKLKIITDHYTSETRKTFNDSLLDDPLLSPSAERRVSSLFEEGFHLELESAIAFDPFERRHLTKAESDVKFNSMLESLQKIVQQLETWKDDVHLIDNMRDAAGVSFAQGRAASLITPGLMDLQPRQLPFSVEIIHYTGDGDPIVDVGLTKKMVAVKTKFENKKITRADELVYLTRNKRGYRKEGKFLGTSPLEPVISISKAIKRIYNYDIPEAVIAAYITKILFTFGEDVDSTTATTFLRNYMTTGKLAFGMSNVDKIDVIQPKVDVQMIDQLEKKLADVALSIIGVPKSMLNREHNLNRDIATIEAIQFIKFVRTPDEALLADEYETQIFNPLLSKLMDLPLNQIPARIKIVRNDPDKDLDMLFSNQQNLEQKKENEVQTGDIQTSDSATNQVLTEGSVL